MTLRIGSTKMQTYYTVVFEQPSKKTGKMLRQVSDYVEDLAWFRTRVEKRGGKIVSESSARQVETIPIGI